MNYGNASSTCSKAWEIPLHLPLETLLDVIIQSTPSFQSLSFDSAMRNVRLIRYTNVLNKSSKTLQSPSLRSDKVMSLLDDVMARVRLRSLNINQDFSQRNEYGSPLRKRKESGADIPLRTSPSDELVTSSLLVLYDEIRDLHCDITTSISQLIEILKSHTTSEHEHKRPSASNAPNVDLIKERYYNKLMEDLYCFVGYISKLCSEASQIVKSEQDVLKEKYNTDGIQEIIGESQICLFLMQSMSALLYIIECLENSLDIYYSSFIVLIGGELIPSLLQIQNTLDEINRFCNIDKRFNGRLSMPSNNSDSNNNNFNSEFDGDIVMEPYISVSPLNLSPMKKHERGMKLSSEVPFTEGLPTTPPPHIPSERKGNLPSSSKRNVKFINVEISSLDEIKPETLSNDLVPLFLAVKDWRKNAIMGNNIHQIDHGKVSPICEMFSLTPRAATIVLQMCPEKTIESAKTFILSQNAETFFHKINLIATRDGNEVFIKSAKSICATVKRCLDLGDTLPVFMNDWPAFKFLETIGFDYNRDRIGYWSIPENHDRVKIGIQFLAELIGELNLGNFSGGEYNKSLPALKDGINIKKMLSTSFVCYFCGFQSDSWSVHKYHSQQTCHIDVDGKECLPRLLIIQMLTVFLSCKITNLLSTSFLRDYELLTCNNKDSKAVDTILKTPLFSAGIKLLEFKEEFCDNLKESFEYLKYLSNYLKLFSKEGEKVGFDEEERSMYKFERMLIKGEGIGKEIDSHIRYNVLKARNSSPLSTINSKVSSIGGTYLESIERAIITIFLYHTGHIYFTESAAATINSGKVDFTNSSWFFIVEVWAKVFQRKNRIFTEFQKKYQNEKHDETEESSQIQKITILKQLLRRANFLLELEPLHSCIDKSFEQEYELPQFHDSLLTSIFNFIFEEISLSGILLALQNRNIQSYSRVISLSIVKDLFHGCWTNEVRVLVFSTLGKSSCIQDVQPIYSPIFSLIRKADLLINEHISKYSRSIFDDSSCKNLLIIAISYWKRNFDVGNIASLDTWVIECIIWFMQCSKSLDFKLEIFHILRCCSIQLCLSPFSSSLPLVSKILKFLTSDEMIRDDCLDSTIHALTTLVAILPPVLDTFIEKCKIGVEEIQKIFSPVCFKFFSVAIKGADISSVYSIHCLSHILPHLAPEIFVPQIKMLLLGVGSLLSSFAVQNNNFAAEVCRFIRKLYEKNPAWCEMISKIITEAFENLNAESKSRFLVHACLYVISGANDFPTAGCPLSFLAPLGGFAFLVNMTPGSDVVSVLILHPSPLKEKNSKNETTNSHFSAELVCHSFKFILRSFNEAKLNQLNGSKFSAINVMDCMFQFGMEILVNKVDTLIPLIFDNKHDSFIIQHYAVAAASFLISSNFCHLNTISNVSVLVHRLYSLSKQKNPFFLSNFHAWHGSQDLYSLLYLVQELGFVSNDPRNIVPKNKMKMTLSSSEDYAMIDDIKEKSEDVKLFVYSDNKSSEKLNFINPLSTSLVDKGFPPNLCDILLQIFQNDVDAALSWMMSPENCKELVRLMDVTGEKIEMTNSEASNILFKRILIIMSSKTSSKSFPRSVAEMISILEELHLLNSCMVKQALVNIPRHLFCSKNDQERAYELNCLFDNESSTLNSPCEVVFMLEALNVMPGCRCLDVGTGTGWVAALMSYICGPEGFVVGADISSSILKIAMNNVALIDISIPTSKISFANFNILLPIYDTLLHQNTLKKHSFDRIFVGASLHRSEVAYVSEYLAPGGILVAIADVSMSHIYKVFFDRDLDDLNEQLIPVPIQVSNTTSGEFLYAPTMNDIVSALPSNYIDSNVFKEMEGLHGFQEKNWEATDNIRSRNFLKKLNLFESKKTIRSKIDLKSPYFYENSGNYFIYRVCEKPCLVPGLLASSPIPKLIPLTPRVAISSTDRGFSVSNNGNNGNFGSCVGNMSVTRVGRWYYEIRIGNSNITQVGWVSPLFNPILGLGLGVGDDCVSWSYDGGRLRKWNKVSGQYGIPYGEEPWKINDIVGCILDLDKCCMMFTLNGVDQGIAFSDIDPFILYSPSASIDVGDNLHFNFGQMPLVYPPYLMGEKLSYTPLVSPDSCKSLDLLGGQLIQVLDVEDDIMEPSFFGKKVKVRTTNYPYDEFFLMSCSLELADSCILRENSFVDISFDNDFLDNVHRALSINLSRKAMPFILASGVDFLSNSGMLSCIIDTLKLSTGLSVSNAPLITQNIQLFSNSFPNLSLNSNFITTYFRNKNQNSLINIEQFLWGLLEFRLCNSPDKEMDHILAQLSNEACLGLIRSSNSVLKIESPHPVRSGSISALPSEIRMCVRLLRDACQSANESMICNQSNTAYDLLRKNIEIILQRLVGVSNSISTNRVLYARSQASLRKALIFSSTAATTAEKCWILVKAAEKFIQTVSEKSENSNNHSVNLRHLNIPGANELLVTFDARCNCFGSLSFFTDEKGENRLSWFQDRDSWAPFRVKGDSIWYSFDPGFEPPHELASQEWGYSIRVRVLEWKSKEISSEKLDSLLSEPLVFHYGHGLRLLALKPLASWMDPLFKYIVRYLRTPSVPSKPVVARGISNIMSNAARQIKEENSSCSIECKWIYDLSALDSLQAELNMLRENALLSNENSLSLTFDYFYQSLFEISKSRIQLTNVLKLESIPHIAWKGYAIIHPWQKEMISAVENLSCVYSNSNLPENLYFAASYSFSFLAQLKSLVLILESSINFSAQVHWWSKDLRQWWLRQIDFVTHAASITLLLKRLQDSVKLEARHPDWVNKRGKWLETISAASSISEVANAMLVFEKYINTSEAQNEEWASKRRDWRQAVKSLVSRALHSSHFETFSSQLLSFRIFACDGGCESEKYGPQNVLLDNFDVYCSSRAKNVNIILYVPDEQSLRAPTSDKDDSSDDEEKKVFSNPLPVCIRKFVLRQPSSSFTCPVANALVFAFYDTPPSKRELDKTNELFGNMNADTWMDYFIEKRKTNSLPHRGEPCAYIEVGFSRLPTGESATCPPWAVVGHYFLIKFLKSNCLNSQNYINSKMKGSVITSTPSGLLFRNNGGSKSIFIWFCMVNGTYVPFPEMFQKKLELAYLNKSGDVEIDCSQFYPFPGKLIIDTIRIKARNIHDHFILIKRLPVHNDSLEDILGSGNIDIEYIGFSGLVGDVAHEYVKSWKSSYSYGRFTENYKIAYTLKNDDDYYFEDDYYIVQCEEQHKVRVAPSISAPILGILRRGEIVRAVGGTRNSNLWIRLQFGSQTGWSMVSALGAEFLVPLLPKYRLWRNKYHSLKPDEVRAPDSCIPSGYSYTSGLSESLYGWNKDIDTAIVNFIDQELHRIGRRLNTISTDDIKFPSTDIFSNYSQQNLRARFNILRVLNSRLETFLSLIDLRAVDMYPYISQNIESISSILIKSKGLIFINIKMNAWKKIWLETLSPAVASEVLVVNRRLAVKAVNILQQQIVDKIPFHHRLETASHTLLGQIISQMNNIDSSLLKRGDGRAWFTKFDGEPAIDDGGLYRETMSLICNEINSGNDPSFISIQNNNFVLPSNNNCVSNILRSVGRMIGIASTHSCSVFPIDFPSLVWKRMVGETPTPEEDLNSIDPKSFGIYQYYNKESDLLMTSGDDDEILDDDEDVNLNWKMTSIEGREIELIPHSPPVLKKDASRYVQLLANWKLIECEEGMDILTAGVEEMVPRVILPIFSWQQYKLIVCGRPEIEINLLRQRTEYGEGILKHGELMQNFWKVLESFSQDERKKFLQFVWGRSRLPVSEYEFGSDFFKIESHVASLHSKMVDSYLPVAHTCFFTLELPNYSSINILRNKLVYAISHCSDLGDDVV